MESFKNVLFYPLIALLGFGPEETILFFFTFLRESSWSIVYELILSQNYLKQSHLGTTSSQPAAEELSKL